jgi:phospholipase/lecithinase/hemolysin
MKVCGLACWLMLLGCGVAGAQARPVRQMFVFGDSYSDTGAGYVDGNGPTAVWYMAKDLGIRLMLPKDAKAGVSVNFAVSGAQTGAGAGKTFEHGELLGYGMQNQVHDFAGMMAKRTERFEAEGTLFYLAGGLNDSSLSVETSVANLEAEIETLYGLGARRFRVALMPETIPGFARQGTRLNPALREIPAAEKARHADMEIALSDWGPDFDAVRTHAAQYGITDTADACAGRVLRQEDPTPCAAPRSYYFYHANHPSTRTHEVVGGMLAAELKR